MSFAIFLNSYNASIISVTNNFYDSDYTVLHRALSTCLEATQTDTITKIVPLGMLFVTSMLFPRLLWCMLKLLRSNDIICFEMFTVVRTSNSGHLIACDLIFSITSRVGVHLLLFYAKYLSMNIKSWLLKRWSAVLRYKVRLKRKL